MSTATDAAKSALTGYQSLDSTTAMNNANTQYDVGGSQTRLSALKGLVGNLQSSVEAVDPSVTGRTTGTFTTEGQRQALVSKERAPILTDLNKQQSAYSDEQGTLNQKQTLSAQMASALLSDDKAKYQRLLDQYNASTAQDAADEQKRQYNETMAENKRQYDLTAAAAAKTAAAGKAPSSGQVQSSAISALSGSLKNAAGRDGYVSPQTYAAAKRDWIDQGYSSAAFDSTFAAYRNPYSEDAKNGAKRSKADYAVG